MTQLGKQVEAFIKRKNMTLEELAAKVGVSRMTLWRWCNGEAKPSPLAEKALRQAGVKVGSK